MKKCFYAVAALAAVVSFASCSKELEVASDEIVIPAGQVMTYEVSLNDPTKISFGDIADKKMPVYWRVNDAFRLITCKTEKYYTDTLKESVTSKDMTDCGAFTTAQDSVVTARFTGTIPAGAVSSSEGIAVFPASAYADSSANVIYNTTSTNCRVVLSSSIPATQDGTGAKYMVAASRLRDGKFNGFSWATALVKIKVPAGLGIDKIVLSTQEDHYYGLANKSMSLYYYFKGTSAENMSLAVTKGCALNSIEVSRNGEELSGDVYFATRGLKLQIGTASTSDTTVLYLHFYRGEQLSKTYSYRLTKAYGGGNVLDFGEINPVFPEQTIVSYKDSDKKKFVPAYPDTLAGEKFPWVTGNSPETYTLHNVSDTDTLSQSWFRTEREYSYGGYVWTFGTTYNTTDSKVGITGKYGYSSASGYIPRIEEKSYIKLPVVPGKKLVALTMTINNSSSKVWWRISSKNTASKTDTGLLTDAQVTMSKAAALTVTIPNTEKDTPYYLVSASSWQPKTIILSYQ